MQITRRGFMKGLLTGTVLGSSALIVAKPDIVLGGLGSTESTTTNFDNIPDDPKRHWGFLIDLSKCNGCIDQQAPDPSVDPTGELPLCTRACRVYHRYAHASPPQYWIRVYQLTEDFQTKPYFFPKPCQNCVNAPCQHVCPTGATYKRKDGTVVINTNICIGCRICMAACPYETRYFWWNDPSKEDDPAHTPSPEYAANHFRGTVNKCDYCVDMAYNGQLPMCVNACPRGVLYYGDLNEDAVSNGKETISLSKTLDQKGGYRYKETEGTNPSVYYLPPAGQSNINGQSSKANNFWK